MNFSNSYIYKRDFKNWEGFVFLLLGVHIDENMENYHFETRRIADCV